jgi:hypothetical protein
LAEDLLLLEWVEVLRVVHHRSPQKSRPDVAHRQWVLVVLQQMFPLEAGVVLLKYLPVVEQQRYQRVEVQLKFQLEEEVQLRFQLVEVPPRFPRVEVQLLLSPLAVVLVQKQLLLQGLVVVLQKWVQVHPQVV